MPDYKIPEATGASIRPKDLEKGNLFPITDFGASKDSVPEENTRAINAAICAASAKGGTVIIPKGTYYTYTILLQSNVNLYLEEGATLAAAKTDITHFYEKQSGEGGNYEEPEVNPYVGVQDHGHSYFANSLLYGADLENIMICGKGLLTGGRFCEENDMLEYVLQGGDPPDPLLRTENGHQGEWFGNKGIALVRCKNIVLTDFSFTIGGHFAIIATGCENLYVDNVLLDTTRDAFDIDCCQNVTLRHTTCNSLTDDGLCLKASFGAGTFMPLKNVLIEDCVVSGYDAGSVYAGAYTRDKLIATDRCGPTGRVKFGTESTCGYHLVTIRRVKFDRSRGFCMESVDCSSLTDVIFEDCTLDNVSSSPIFLRAGDRARFPVTGANAAADYPPTEPNVRLDGLKWVLPNTPSCLCYPAKRYAPHYNRTKTVTVDGHSFFEIIDEASPVTCNPVNYGLQDGRYYLKTWCGSKDNQTSAQDHFTTGQNHTPHDQTPPSDPNRLKSHLAQSDVNGTYEIDLSHEIEKKDLPLYANAIGCESLASIKNVRIRNVTITNADPRYPILLMGLTDSHIENVVLENISVEYRGGLTMEHAVEQRQLNTDWKYSQFHAKEQVQNLPWLVNTFFLKNEGLLPRADWDVEGNCWKPDAYNIPELPDVYPEPSNWGILPAYGIFARHVTGLTLRDIKLSCKTPDERHVCVLDDVNDVCLDGMEAFCNHLVSPIALITHHYRRHTNEENVPEQPYFTTKVTGLKMGKPLTFHENCTNDADRRPEASCQQGPACSLTHKVLEIEIHAPAPGTPQDSLYPYPTSPCLETGYQFAVDTDHYPLPLTVYRPFIQPVAPIYIVPGETCTLTLTVRHPAMDVSPQGDSGMIYNEKAARINHSVKGINIPLTLYCENLPWGAAFDPVKKEFTWTPTEQQTGHHTMIFTVNDGIIPERTRIQITVAKPKTN